MKKHLILILLSMISSTAWASFTENTPTKEEETSATAKDSPFGLTLQLSSRYIWRGLEYGDAPVSFATLNYGTGGFSAWAMGAYAFNGSHQEVDLGVNYKIKDLLLGISDYYYPSAVGTSDDYFDTNNHTTGHWGELYATFAPAHFWITMSCYIYGADKKQNGEQAYSSYAEIAYSFDFKNDNKLSLATGASLNRGFYTGYEKGFSIVNIEIKYSTSFQFGSFKLPVSGAYIVNPAKEKSYFNFSTFFNI